MAPAKPMLDGVELPQAQRIASEDDEVLAQHGVPALEGDFLQDLGRRAVRVTLSGVMTGAEAGDDLKGLREKFRGARPVPFVSDIATATRLDKVLIEEMGVRELAGKPERFEYALALREYTPPPAVTEEVPPEIPVPPVPLTATLIVEVLVEGDPNFDFSRVTVTASGTGADGTAVSRTLANRSGNVWTEADFPPGRYTVEAAVAEPEAMTGSAPAEVREGETTQVSITLHRGAAIAKAFVIHFWFDKAFIEPCLREVLRRVVAYSDAHTDEKVLIVGHTDLTGPDNYNQSLSERRARSIFAFLTFGRDRKGAVAEWNELRQARPNNVFTSVKDTWDTREYQYMLQDLGFYLGNIDEDHGTATTAAIRAFQTDNGLTPSGAMDEATWKKLVAAYMEQDSLALPEERFFRNARGACNSGVLKWIGCGETDPVLNTQMAWRPNRRTEILFFKTGALPPGDIPEPDTFNLPKAGAVGPGWCLGPRNPNLPRCPFTTRKSPPPPGKVLIRPAEPGKVKVNGTITFEDSTPVVNAKYSLTAPDGEYLNTQAAGANPVLEEKQADPAPNLPPRLKQKGRPIPNRADEKGRFSFERETPEGVYILEIQELTAPQVARSAEDAPGSGVGNVVCFRLDAAPPAGQQTAGVTAPAAPAAPARAKGGVVQSGATTLLATPEITPANPVVVVRRSYTNPTRTPITLRSTAPTRRNGTLSRSGNTGAIHLFRTATGGTEIAFNGTDNVFSGSLLSRSQGVQLFAESDTPSGSVGDYQLSLTLGGGTPAVANLTAVRVTLNIFTTREPSGTAPQPFDQPPPAPPPAAVATDKWFRGGRVNVHDTPHTQERVKLRVEVIEPNDFVGALTLQQLAVRGNNFGSPVSRVQAFDNATQTPGESPVASTIPVNGLSFPGEDFFLEGISASAASRDTGFQLGIQGASADGDRVALTVGVGVSLTQSSAQRAVVVKRPHTNPTRPSITLRTTTPLPASRSGRLTVAATSGAIRLFRADGSEITFTSNNVFTGAELTAGVRVFAEGVSACTGNDHIQLVVTLSPGSPAEGIPGSTRLTAVALTLDIARTRTAAGVDPAVMSEADKVGTGRFVHQQDPGLHHGRAKLLVRPIQPASFAGRLSLVPVDARVALFSDEIAAAGQRVIGTPFEILSGLIFPPGMALFAEGQSVSGNLRDTGFRLELDGQEGDRIAMTVVRFSNLTADIPSTPARTARLGNSPVARHTLTRGAGAALNAADFDEAFDFASAANRPLVLIRGAVTGADPINLSVQVTPAGAPVSWSVQRDIRPAPAGDSAQVVALSPNPRPTLTANAADPLRATLLSDAVGSFYVRPFIDINGNGTFDHNVDREPFILLHLVLVQVTLFQDDSAPHDTITATSDGAGGIVVSGGTFNIAAPQTAAVHLNVQADVVGGGGNGRRGVDRVFAGWDNNIPVNLDIAGTFRDNSVAPPVNRREFWIFASNRTLARGGSPDFPTFLPGDPLPDRVDPPLLDTGRLSAGTGGDTMCLTSSRIRSRTDLALGQRLLVEAVDSPGNGADGTHPGFAAARLVQYRFHLDFRAFLCFWTNVSGGSGATGDPADRLYCVLQSIDWRMRGEWSIAPATGALTVVTAPSVRIPSRATFNPIAPAAGTAEVRFPTALNLFTRDARS